MTFVAEHDGTPVGIAGGYWSDRGAGQVDLLSMWVDPGARGSGAGRRLVEAVLGWAAEAGARSVGLWVTRGNEAAVRLYESAGFEPDGQFQPLPSDPCKEELRMVREL